MICRISKLAGVALVAATVSASGAPRAVEIRLQVPDGGWRVDIERVYRVGDELWVLSQLERRPGMAIQVISTVSDQVTVEAPALPVRHYVAGKRWGWANGEAIRFVPDFKALEPGLADAALLYRKPAPSKPPANAATTVRLIVMYRQGLFGEGAQIDRAALEARARHDMETLGGKNLRVLGIIHGFTAEFPAAAEAALRALPDVRSVERDTPIGLDPPRR